MPTRTELVISFGEVLDCLPPGKAYKRRRYNSFDANIGPLEGNEENLAPSSGIKPCRDMKTDQRSTEEPEVLAVKGKRVENSHICDETDDEISFRDIRLNGDSPEDGKNKSKRKSNAERFLEDNANYFQLEVLSSKTRSNKLLTDGESDDEEDGKGGFHTSFLDFLKSKGVEKDSTGRSRHKSAESEIGERASSRTAHGRSRSSHSRFGRSRSSARSVNGRERSLSTGRSKSRTLLAGVDGSEVFISESESECSVRLPRIELDRVKAGPGRSESPSDSSESSGRSRRQTRARSVEATSESESEPPQTTRQTRAKSVARDTSPSGSEAEVFVRSRRGKSAVRAGSATESEAETPSSSRQGRSLSPESEVEAQTTRARRGKSPTREEASESEVETPVSSKRSKSAGRDLSPSESEADVPTTRSRRGKSSARDLSPSGSEADAPTTTTRSKRGKSASRDEAASESEVDQTPVRTSRSKSTARTSRSSARDVSPSESEADAPVRPRRGNRKDVSPSGSEAESLASNTSKHKHDKAGAKDSDGESEDEFSKQSKSSGKKETESPQSKKNRRNPGRRTELDKLLEAVDTSFHYETAAAERKRMSDTGLGPLEIDCSDTGSEASCNISNKRKFSETETSEEANNKKCKGSNNLLKTASPGTMIKSEDQSEDESESVSGPAWDGWDALNAQLETITEDPVEISKMHFSFETEPVRESWYSTYQRQDRGDELVFYPTSTTAPFYLPYEMPYSTFLGTKPGKRDTDTSRDQSKASSPVRQLVGPAGKKGKRKISECESTDSDDTRRGKSRSSKANSTTSSILPDKLGPKGSLLLEPNYRVSPRCHASTKSLGLSGGLPGDLDDLAEAYLMQDERELLGFPHLATFLQSEENSNDSFSSGSVNYRVRSESSAEMLKLAACLDSLMQNPGDLPGTPLSPTTPAKVPPTRSRVSSDQLLSPKKTKKKKKLSSSSEQVGVSPLDQLVADNVDPVLLDCLEDELPTVPGPLDTVGSSPMELLETFSTCTSMSVCNSRWLRPNKRDSLISNKNEPRLENKLKKLPSPNKPKRIIIYKDDLPGFSIDSDMEAEKLPVSKRGMAKAQTDTDKQEQVVEGEEKDKSPVKKSPLKDSKKGEIKKSDKKEDAKKPLDKKDTKAKDEEDNHSDEDSESVESFSSNSSGSKKRRKTNKTGFPSPKKKKKPMDNSKNASNQKSPQSSSNQSKPTKSKSDSTKPDVKSPGKSGSKLEKPKLNAEKSKQSSAETKITPKKKVSKQIKMDRFITKKSVKKAPTSTTDKSKPTTSSSPVVPLVASRRSAALKAKNYSELESDTESLLESPLILSSSPCPAPGQIKPKAGSVHSKGVKKR
eukprot:GFUD01029020.1.p1 GENE.GFUD01029020.1~~GFUD01029020.1.p1  ORF type:complete len:1351 (-),score=455.67 GFUD01029020.1:27-4079(-)